MNTTSNIAQLNPLRPEAGVQTGAVQTQGDGRLCTGTVDTMPDTLCSEMCKYGRRDEGDMTRCCLCAGWYHEECVGMTTDADWGGASGPARNADSPAREYSA